MLSNKTLAASIAAVALACGGFFAGRVTAPTPPRTHVSRAVFRPTTADVQAGTPMPPDAPADADVPAGVGQVDLPAPSAPDQPPAPVADNSGQVWVNTNTGIYHVPGSRWYGQTSEGKYMSEHDALAAGYRRSARG